MGTADALDDHIHHAVTTGFPLDRIDHITADPDANGTGLAGFTGGTVSTQVPATVLTAAWANGVQEEIALAIEGAGLTLDSGTNAQLLSAMHAGVAITVTLAASQNNYAPTGWSTASVVRLDPSGSYSITGFDATAGVKRKLVVNVDAVLSVTFPSASGSSSAANRFITDDGASYVLLPGTSVWLYYDATSTAWRLTSGSSKADVEISPTSFGTSQNDYAPTGWATASIVMLTPTASVSVTGFESSAITARQQLRKLIYNRSATYSLSFAHGSASSVAANRITTSGSVANFVLGPQSWAQLYYDTTTSRWFIAPLGVDHGLAHAWLGLHTFDLEVNVTDALYATGDIGTGGNFVYTTPPSVLLTLPIEGFRGADFVPSSYGTLYTTVDDAVCYFGLSLPGGCTITRVRCGYTQTGNPGAGNEATLTLRRTAPNKTTGAAAAPTSVGSVTGDAAAGTYMMDTGTIAVVLNRGSYVYALAWKAPGGSASSSELNWVDVSFTDPGPRNF